MKSVEYWKNRYSRSNIKGASGNGSVGELLKFKTDFINEKIAEYNIESVLDFGHGDLGLANGIEVDRYIGLDIFDFPKSEFVKDSVELINTSFDEYDGDSCDMTMCIDVLYHILEPEQDYMRKTVDKMFAKAKRCVIIYAQDSLNSPKGFGGGSHLYDSKWRQHVDEKYLGDWTLVHKQDKSEPNSSALMFVYLKGRLKWMV